MKYTLVMNGFAGNPSAKAREMNGFLRGSGLAPEDGTTILFHGEDAAQLLPLVPTAAVILVRVDRHQPEQALAILQELAAPHPADLVLFFDDLAGRELSVRLGHRLGGTSLTSVRSVAAGPDGVRCTRAVYGNHVEAAFSLQRRPCCLAIAKGSCVPAPLAGPPPRVLAELDRRGAPGAWIEHWETRPVPPAAGLEQAKFILAVGMGAGTKEKAAGLAGLAGAMGAELAVSRPVAMNAWASMDRLVGVSGAVTRAGVCIVAGASGSAAFMAGIEHGGFIVALNSDPAAPIFRCADLGAVGDCVAIVEELARLVRAGGGRP